MTGFITNGMSMVHAPDVLIMISILNYNFYAEMVPKLSSIHTPTMSAMRGGKWTRSTWCFLVIVQGDFFSVLIKEDFWCEHEEFALFAGSNYLKLLQVRQF